MSLEIDCPSCQRKFRVPDSTAGKKIRCPKCQGAIQVPSSMSAAAVLAGSKPASPVGKDGEWYLKDEEGNNYGPVSRAALDQWLEDGRITADCQLLAVGSQQWQWASELYPELEEEADEEEVESANSTAHFKAEATQPAWSPAAISIGSAKSTAPAIEVPAPVITPQAPVTAQRPTPPVPTEVDHVSRSSRSKAIAGLLGVFLGPLGTHRFYLGYWGVGLAMLLTLGGCGVWSLIDAACVILGRVPDADGRPLSD